MSTGMETLQEKDRVALELRALFSRYGYTGYKMSRFEEYELYLRNKDFLTCDRMIVFTDLNGVLMALKPDVTISIIKNTNAAPGTVKKVYYTENVYRADAQAGAFKEIMQTGLECIGDIDLYQLCEVIQLAVKSLELIDRDYVLAISHLGLVSGALAAAEAPEELYGEALKLIRDKNLAGLTRFCALHGLNTGLLTELVATYGEMEQVLGKFRGQCANDLMRAALDDLARIHGVLAGNGLAGRVRLDFSVVNDMRYYNGIIFQGFINGIPTSVLAGGQYDQLMHKMGKPQGAVGFAVYVDELESLDRRQQAYDADILLLYPPDADLGRLSRAVETLTARGERVTAQKTAPETIRCRRILRLEDWRDEHDGLR